MRKRALSLILPILFGTGDSIDALADGMVIGPEFREIYESKQIAYLEFDPDTERERLHILPKLSGDAKSFAWIVPTPSLPEVSESELGMFQNLAELTQRKNVSREWDSFGCDQGGYSAAPGESEDGIDIFEEELIGIYQTMILSASDSQILADSLTEWGFLHEGNTDEVIAVLDSYVSEDWYFVTMKVDSSAFDGQDSWGGYWNRPMQPMLFEFQAPAPVYPMRISAISVGYRSSVLLYLKAAHRMQIDNCDTLYANRLTAEELAEIRSAYPHLSPHLAAGDYITKLQRYLYYNDFEDFYPRQADSDAEYYPIHYSGLPPSLLLLLVLGFALRFWGRMELRNKSS